MASNIVLGEASSGRAVAATLEGLVQRVHAPHEVERDACHTHTQTRFHSASDKDISQESDKFLLLGVGFEMQDTQGRAKMVEEADRR